MPMSKKTTVQPIKKKGCSRVSPRRSRVSTPRRKDRDFSLLRAGRACGVPQFQLPQRTPGQTRQARDGRRGPPGGAWAGPGAHCGVGPAWVLGGFFLASCPPITARDRLLAATICSTHRQHASLLLRAACAFAAPAPTAEGPRSPAPPGPRRATGRPVRLGGASELGP